MNELVATHSWINMPWAAQHVVMEQLFFNCRLVWKEHSKYTMSLFPTFPFVMTWGFSLGLETEVQINFSVTQMGLDRPSRLSKYPIFPFCGDWVYGRKAQFKSTSTMIFEEILPNIRWHTCLWIPATLSHKQYFIFVLVITWFDLASSLVLDVLKVTWRRLGDYKCSS